MVDPGTFVCMMLSFTSVVGMEGEGVGGWWIDFTRHDVREFHDQELIFQFCV